MIRTVDLGNISTTQDVYGIFGLFDLFRVVRVIRVIDYSGASDHRVILYGATITFVNEDDKAFLTVIRV